MESTHTIEVSPVQPAARARPRLSRRTGFWAVSFSFLVMTAFSTAPSSLYGLYEHSEHLSSLTITFVYGVYAVGVIASLVLFGHVSDWYGRRIVMLPAMCTAIVATVIFLVWRSLGGLFLARILTGLALGATVATATAFITDLDPAPSGGPSRRAGIVGTIANIGGLATGALIAGVLAAYAPHPLTLPFEILLALLVLAAISVALAPEGHPPTEPQPTYRPQRLSVPESGRRRFTAAAIGVFMSFATFGLFAGLAGVFLAGPLHHPSPALCGLTIFLTFGTGVVVQTTTTSWPAHRLIAAGIIPALIGLGVVVASAWTSPPSLGLFLSGGVIVGAGGGALFRGSLTVAISSSDPNDRASVLASFFTAGFLGLSVPVVGLGLALQYLSPRTTLLIFGLIVGAGILAAAPVLVRPLDSRAR
jgi:MFS family permease